MPGGASRLRRGLEGGGGVNIPDQDVLGFVESGVVGQWKDHQVTPFGRG